VIRDGAIVASGTEEELSGKIVSSRVAFAITVRIPAGENREAGIARVAELIGAVRGVQGTEIGGGAADEATVVVTADGDVRERVVRELVRADVGVLLLERSSRELEDVFFQLTGGEGKV
jgi:ABC-type multidrug transport system ATPase subunit